MGEGHEAGGCSPSFMPLSQFVLRVRQWTLCGFWAFSCSELALADSVLLQQRSIRSKVQKEITDELNNALFGAVRERQHQTIPGNAGNGLFVVPCDQKDDYEARTSFNPLKST